MSESLIISGKTRQEKYEELMPQLGALLDGETNLISRMAMISGCLNETFGFLWVGFYLPEHKTETLTLGPYQGPLPCLRIPKGKGVCGVAWAQSKPQIVPNVDEFPGHIACSSSAKSELVIPFYRSGEFLGVLDIDSTALNDFSSLDVYYLNRILENEVEP